MFQAGRAAGNVSPQVPVISSARIRYHCAFICITNN